MTKYIKLTNVKCEHNKFKFKEGLNIDTITITKGECEAGGLYFTTMEYILKWLSYGNEEMY